MGVGPPVCGKCLVLMKMDVDIDGPFAKCFVCNEREHHYGMWEFDDEHQDFIRRRTHLYNTKQMVQYDLTVVAKSRRPWPSGDPNDLIRPWLESNIGMQGVDWNWDMDPNNFNNIEYYFSKEEYATLFELSW